MLSPVKPLICFIIGLLAAFPAQAFGPQNSCDQLTDTLLQAISRKPDYAALRQQRVDSLKILLQLPRQTPLRRLGLTSEIASAYTRFRSDSAMAYTIRAISLADSTRSPLAAMRQRLRLANLYCKVSKFREAWDILQAINPDQLPSPELLPDYRYALMNFYETYAASVPDGEKYLDYYRHKLLPDYLAVASDTTFEARTRRTCLLIDKDPAEAERQLLRLAQREEYGSPNWGGIMYMISIARDVKGDPQGQRKFLQLAAIADTRSANREHASLQTLADVELRLGEPTQRAFLYTQTAMEDALDCGVRFRMNQMHNLYALVNRQAAEQEAAWQNRLTLYLCITGALLLLFLAASLWLVVERRKLHRARRALAHSNASLSASNASLSAANEQLRTLNKRLKELSDMKERYIAQFFDLYSDYLAKVEKRRVNVGKLLRQGRTGELQAMFDDPESTTADLDDLYRHFDTTFLSLYPDFVARINAQLLPEEQITLRPGELLNRELRFYALQRLGITDSQRVASFLRCALSTIYNYRASLRRRTRAGREAFDAAIDSL